MNVIITSAFLFGLCGPADCIEPHASFTQAKKDNVAKKHKPSFTVGKETTHVTGPLDKDGYIDYSAALNELLGKGVTPANNANVLLWQAFGPHLDGATMPPRFFEWMKISAPPEKGKYFVGAEKFMKPKLVELDHGKRFDDMMDKVCLRHWKAQEHPQVAEWLKVNEKPLALVVEASKRTRYFSPQVPTKAEGLITALGPGVQGCRQLAKSLAARAMLRVGDGRTDDAWQDLLACHRLGRHVGRGATLIEGLVGNAIESLASEADLAFLERAKLDARQIQRCLRDLQALPPMPGIADKIDLGERFMFLDTVMYMNRAGMLSPDDDIPIPENITTINWDHALRDGNQMYTRVAAAMRLKDRGLREKRLREIEADCATITANLRDVRTQAKAIFAAKDPADVLGKIMGYHLIRLMFPAVTKLQHTADRAEQTQNNLHVAFALAAYKSDNGKYAKTLDALAPKYLAAVPQDLFSGKELIYRPSENGYLLYSVGVNGRDDDGRSYDDDPPGDDLPVRMPLPKLLNK